MEALVNYERIKKITEAQIGNPLNDLTDKEKITLIAGHFEKIMQTLGLNLNDDSLNGTPNRVAKMYVKELFSGLRPENKPQILVEKDITLFSCCEHHFVPIIGKAHVAYIPHKQVIGLSKINRLVQYYAKRPQVQERLTIQIAEALTGILQHDDVAVLIEADHLCVASRGIKDTNSQTVTSSYSGHFENNDTRQEFLSYLNNKK